jgi:hypothetical protein
MFKAPARLRHLLREIRRRSVHKVAVSYSVGSWLIIQVAANTFPYLGLPAWSVSSVIVAVLAGFPIALLVGWFYDLSPIGLVRDPHDSLHGQVATVAEGTVTRVGAPPNAGDGRDEDAPPGPVRLQLPAQPTPFLGRKKERLEVRKLLKTGARVVTITGPGGVGKTRLAIQAASDLQPYFADGVAFVSAADTDSQEAFASLVAESLGIAAAGDRPDRTVRDFLENKHLLLVIDNFEQMISQAADLSKILEYAAGVSFLVTSRERLGLRAETVVSLDGLSFPADSEGADPSRFESFQLFLRTATRVQRGFRPSADPGRQNRRRSWQCRIRLGRYRDC